jgi:hypothetical protein
MNKIFTLSDDCLLDAHLHESGIPGILTLDLLRQFPHAQRPRWQLELQISASPVALWELCSFVHTAIHSHQSDQGSKKAT